MRRTGFSWIFIIGLLIILTACTTPATVPVENQPQQEEQQPPADSEQESIEGDSDEINGEDTMAEAADEESEVEASVIDPAAIFSSNCAGCHGADRSGVRGPSLLPDRLTQEASYYANIITNGSGGMPSWEGRLSAEEINAMAEWILTELE
jgi:mono/diheme cytochrome c family protein